MNNSTIQLNNHTILITGGNDGIGYATAKNLAQKGATIILACRNQEKGQAASKAIQSETGNDRIDVIPLDLSDFAKIREAAETFREKYDQLDVLINNAAAFTEVTAGRFTRIRLSRRRATNQ